MGQVHCAAWQELGVGVQAIYSPAGNGEQEGTDGLSQSARAAQVYGAVHTTSIDTFLEQVDIVDICSPTDTHAEWVTQAAGAGKDILCEKPLALSMSDARKMIAACSAAGVRLMVGHVLRFFPQYRQAHHQVHSAEFGTPAVIRCYRHCFTPHLGTPSWFCERSRSGGVALDLMLHDIDFALSLAGEVRSVDAYRFGGTPEQCGNEHVIAILQHTSGALSHIEGSWAYPAPIFRMGYEIAGSADRLLRYDSYGNEVLAIHARGSGDGAQAAVPKPPAASPSPYYTEIAEFYRALTTGSDFPVKTDDALAALETALKVAAVSNANVAASGGAA